MKPINKRVGYFDIVYASEANISEFPVRAILDPETDSVMISVTNLFEEPNAARVQFSLNGNLIPDSPATVNFGETFRQSFKMATLGEDDYDIEVLRFPNGGDADRIATVSFDIVADEVPAKIQLQRPGFEASDDEQFWLAIKKRQLDFNSYFSFISKILYRRDLAGDADATNVVYNGNRFGKIHRRNAMKRSPFIGVNEYNLLKFGTEFYMLAKSMVNPNDIQSYLGANDVLPYYEHISDAFNEAMSEYPDSGDGLKIKNQRFKNPFLIELIWSYWMEQGMLMQAMNLINLRFQNISVGNGQTTQLSRFDVSPLRPLSHILWGFIQDEQHRLSLPRRVQEYDHEYGLILTGKAVPSFIPADTRTKFLEAFHNLLTTTSIFFKEADDTTRIADAFPVLNSLKEVHLLLAEGNHNAYGNLTWTARNEMLMTQYIIARDEVRIFLGGRPMVPYPETWMDRIDTVRNMMGWGTTSITYYYDLAVHGEKVLLSIRYGDWSDANMPASNAANWAIGFRDSIQKYIHAYRTVTGVDLSADANIGNSNRTIQPAFLIQRRVSEEKARQRRA
jgi:hypothetical protein